MIAFVILSVLIVAPSGSFGLPLNEGVPGSVGHHGNVQSGQRRFIEEAPVVYCAGCIGGDGQNNSPVSVYSGSSILTLPPIDNNNKQHINTNNNNKGFAFANNPLIDRIDLNAGNENVVKGNQNPASVQYINMNQDGQYNFAYSALDSSRQERRNLDGSVEGSYSYTNPAGRLIEIQYTAGADSGFNAYGENVPPRQIAYTPVPVQDTPAVKAAREEFLNRYAQELNRINSAKAQEQLQLQQQQQQLQFQQQQQQLQLQQQQPSQIQISQQTAQQPEKTNVALPLNTQNSQSLPISGIVSDNKQKPDTYDDEDDTEVVYAALANSQYNNPLQQNENSNKATFYNENTKNSEFRPENLLSGVNNKEQSSYGFWTKETVTPAAQIPLSNTQSQNNQQNQLPSYFYYVSVGGAPHYVTSNTNSLVKSNFPTSLRATLLGAAPIAAVHDAQVRHSGEKVQQKASPPLYLDLSSNGQENNVQNKQAAVNTYSVVNLPSQQVQGQSQVSSFQTNNQPSPAFSQVQLIGYPVFVV